MIFTTVTIADIHFGAIPANKLYDELKSTFIKYIKNHHVDMVVIAGDFYNSLMSLNSPSALSATQIISDIIESAKENNIRYIRIIEGTLSHDNFQIKQFSIFEKIDGIDFKIITEITTEVIEGMKFLFIPEEYGKSMNEYKYFLDVPKKYYDMIFGHGMFKETSFESDDENRISTSVIWDSKLLASICKGPVIFGHIHTSQIIRKNIYYCGSFSRWSYGQEEPKGFYIFIYEPKSHKYLYDFIENKKADKYDTIIFNLDNFPDDIDVKYFITKSLETIKDNLRIQIIIGDPEKDYTFKLNFLKEYFTGKPKFKLQIIDKRSIKMQEEATLELQKTNTEYNYIFDKNVSLKTKISKYIRKEYNEEISEDIIKDLLDIN